MSTPPDLDGPPDYGWDNRRALMASLIPKTASRPGRRGAPAAAADGDAADGDKKPSTPGLFAKGLGAARRAGQAGRGRFNKAVPPGRRGRSAVIAGASIVVLVVAVGVVKSLSSDVAPPGPIHSSTASSTPVSSPAAAPMAVLTGIHGTDKCPHDPAYADANLAFDGDLNTAWVCTRVHNKDGQYIFADFGRQVMVCQMRVYSGAEGTDPDGSDRWFKHRIVTQLDAWFPKELNRKPLEVRTGGERDYFPATIDPPAIVTKLLLRVAATADPGTPATATSQPPAAPGGDQATTVALKVQFLGFDLSQQPAPPGGCG